MHAPIEIPSVEDIKKITGSVQSDDSCDSAKTEIVDTSDNTVLSDHSYTKNLLENTKLCLDVRTNESSIKDFQKHSSILEHDYLGSIVISDDEENQFNELNNSNISQISSISSSSGKRNELNEYVSPFSVVTEKLTSDEEDLSEMQTNLENETQVLSSSINNSLNSVLNLEENIQTNEKITDGAFLLTTYSKRVSSDPEDDTSDCLNPTRCSSPNSISGDISVKISNASKSDKTQIESTFLNKSESENNESVSIDRNDLKLLTDSGSCYEDTDVEDKCQVENTLGDKSEKTNNKPVTFVDRNKVALLTDSERSESNDTDNSMDVETSDDLNSESNQSFVFDFKDIGNSFLFYLFFFEVL